MNAYNVYLQTSNKSGNFVKCLKFLKTIDHCCYSDHILVQSQHRAQYNTKVDVLVD